MAFTIDDFQDLVRLLVQRPEWQAELRRLLLADDFLALPGIVRELAEAQRQSEARLTRLEATVAELAEAQKRTEQRVEELAEAQRNLIDQVAKLTERVDRLTDRVGRLDGRMLERAYHEKAGAYFGPLLRRLRVVPPHTLEDDLEARLSGEEFQDVLRLDLLVNGQARRAAERSEVWLAVEISVVIDREDVERAVRRAALLQKAGYRAIPLVAGEQMTAGAEGEARAASAAVLLDGHALHWEEALATLDTKGREKT